MILLTSTSDILRLVTGAAASITVSCDYVDLAGSVVTPGHPSLTAPITTAATTTIVAAPAASTQRNVKCVFITNNHASASTGVIVQKYDGAFAEDLMGVTLLAGENLILDETGQWTHHDAQGAPYAYAAPAAPNLGITGTLAETMPRELCPEVNTAFPPSGQLWLQAIRLTAGQVINTIDLWSATTAAVTPTNQIAGIYDNVRNLVATSANRTTTAIAAQTQQNFALTAPYRVPVTGLYYIGFFITATTGPTWKGGATRSASTLSGAGPSLQGISTTGLTTALPSPALVATANTASIYAAVR